MKFIDTNVLVYLADKHDVDKRECRAGLGDKDEVQVAVL